MLHKQKLAKATLINLSSRIGLGILGLLQVILIAKTFGASATTDAYMVAIWIPLFIWGMGDSVLVYSLVPHLVTLEVQKSPQESKDASDHIFSWFFLCLLIVALIIFLGAPYLVYILVPGFSHEARNLTIELLKWMSPAVLLGGLTAFFSSLLFAKKKFSIPAIAALFPDIGAITFILFGIDRWGIKAVIIGFLSGILIQLLTLSSTLLKLRIFPKFRFEGIDKFKSVTKTMGPRFGGVGINRAIIGVDRFFASLLGAGAVSILTYSFRLTQLPVLMTVSAFGKTLMPTISKEVALGNMDNVRKFIPRAIGFVIFGLAPIVFLLIYYRESIIRILYQRGEFTPENTAIAANVLVYYCLAILFQSVGVIFSGIFYASGDTWTPFKITLFSLFLNIILDFVLMNLFGIVGIAIATLCVATISMLILYYRLSIRIGKIEISHSFKSLIKIAIATGLMGLTIWGLTGVLTQILTYETLKGQFIKIGLFTFFSLIVFLLTCRFLKLEEYLTVEFLVGKKLGRQKHEIYEKI